jgi:hypothetical protein
MGYEHTRDASAERSCSQRKIQRLLKTTCCGSHGLTVFSEWLKGRVKRYSARPGGLGKQKKPQA